MRVYVGRGIRMIRITKGINSKPNYETGWIEHEYDGNTIVEFIHPDDQERKILTTLFSDIFNMGGK